MSETRFLSRVMSSIGRFRRDSRGNIAVTFGIAVIPVISAIGCAVDYSLASRIRAKLQSAADAASVVAISQNSPGYNAAVLMTSDGPIVPGLNDAKAVFNGNITNTNVATGSLLTLDLTGTAVTKTGSKLNSTVKFTADVPVTFMQVVGINKMTVTGTSAANASLPLYLDFYVALDVSGSMGLPSTPDEAQRMQWVSPDNYIQYPTGCTLACHFAPQNSACIDPGKPGATQGYPTNGYCLGYAISRVNQPGFQNLLQAQSPLGTYPYKNLNQKYPNTLGKSQQLSPTLVSGLPGSLYAQLPPVSSCPTVGSDNCIQLRLDAVGVALNATKNVNGVDGLFATATNPLYQKVPNQFRIGLYPFIQRMNTNYSTLTSTINASPTTPGTINYAAANLATLLDTNTDSALGSGGTHIDQAMTDLNGAITSVGNGSASNNTLPYVFLITDGAQDPQIKGVPNGSWSGSNHATTIAKGSASPCKPLRDRGIIISVLNIPYQTISPVNSSFANDEDDFANNNIANIKASLQDCASPADASGTSYYYEATSPDQITAALNAMFNHALVTAHLTN